ncbi:MAG: hypothetical protein PHY09_16210 [Desulfuromonadaceae bacterium]|nr:hypothetical protein [Desulfuromonadaceae bacterium]MDD5105468.1 hypothetical protein [Desulfuromonadaceae bacterium]
MKNISCGLIVLLMLACSVTPSEAQLSIGIGLPNVSIGINLPFYPQLSPVPGYPVYYAPEVNANYFFYDGMYWVYQDDNWYASSWYNGPWAFVEPYAVPLFVLRIPVRYYRQPPVYFRGWLSSAPPRWGQHWGRDWERRRGGWDRWNRHSVPKRAPRPSYQSKYTGDRYPQRIEEQHTLRSRSYRYQPRDMAVRQHIRQQADQKRAVPDQRGRHEAAPERNQRQIEPQRSAPHQQGAPAGPRTQPPQRGGEQVQRSTPPQQHAPAVREQRPQGKKDSQGSNRGQERKDNRDEDRGQNKDENRGRGHDK